MLDPLFVVFARASTLDCLPSKYIPDGIIPQPLQPSKVDMCVLAGKGPRMKVDTISVKKFVGNMGRLVWIAGILRISCQIDTSEGYLTTTGIAELAIFNSKPQGHIAHFSNPKAGVSGRSSVADED